MTYFSNEAAEFVYTRTYSRWMEDQQRRESWPETVGRYIDWLKSKPHLNQVLDEEEFEGCRQAILNMEVMPSMRALWSAGVAADANNIALFNCSYVTVKDIHVFAEAAYILMSGCGLGFSVEEDVIKTLPGLPSSLTEDEYAYIIADSKEGWADSITYGLECLFKGDIPKFDYSLIRRKGAKLKTMGGRASGPGPLKDLHAFMIKLFKDLVGNGTTRLSPLNCHDIMCKIAEIVVMGGVRRSSCISLSDMNSNEMKTAKDGTFPTHRYMANNSYIVPENMTELGFLEEWTNLAKSGSGERGIFNRPVAYAKRKLDVQADQQKIGVNPCGEIILLPFEFCNLTEVVVRAHDNVASLCNKIRYATLLGLMQSTFTNFPYLREEFKINCEEERLLGISLTGIMDCPEILNKEVLSIMKKEAWSWTKEYCSKMNISTPKAITTVKPSGTVSQLVDSASGCHPRYSNYYIRRYRIASTDPLFKMMKDQGFLFTPEVGQDQDSYKPKFLWDKWDESKVSTWVVEFPIKAPDDCVTRDDLKGAVKQLEMYKLLEKYWCDHNPSITIYVKENEWLSLGKKVYDGIKNGEVIGVSFLPFNDEDHIYPLAPYEEITKKQYDAFPKLQVDYSKLSQYETSDHTAPAATLACSGDKCELK